jgi:2-oxoglutarate dehydrogenase E1 component
LAEFTEGGFRPVIGDSAASDPEPVRRLLLCSGRIYFTLEEARRERSLHDVALIRLEQLYPFPRRELQELIARYPNMKSISWVQEEPRNMGSWSFVEPRLRELLSEGCDLVGHSRPAAASPATGSFRAHQAEEQLLVERALGTDRRCNSKNETEVDRVTAAK